MRKKSNKEKGLDYENIVASMIKKHTSYDVVSKTIGSGCFWHSKGDLVISKFNDYLVEIKGTAKDSYRLSATKIEKIWGEALEDSKIPMFAVLFVNKNVRTLALIEIGMVTGTSLENKRTHLIKAEELDVGEHGYIHGSISLTGTGGRTWVLSIESIKETK